MFRVVRGELPVKDISSSLGENISEEYGEAL